MEQEQTKERRRDARWVQLVVVVVVAIYAILFIALNTHHVKVSFVFFTARASVIWVVMLSLAVGFALGVLGPRLYRHRQRRR